MAHLFMAAWHGHCCNRCVLVFCPVRFVATLQLLITMNIILKSVGFIMFYQFSLSLSLGFNDVQVSSINSMCACLLPGNTWRSDVIIPVGWSKACHFCKPKTLHSESFSFESAAYLHGGIHIVHRVELGIQEATCYLWDHGQMTNHWKKSRVTTDIVGLGCGQCRQQRPEKKQSPKQKGFKCKKKTNSCVFNHNCWSLRLCKQCEFWKVGVGLFHCDWQNNTWNYIKILHN